MEGLDNIVGHEKNHSIFHQKNHPSGMQITHIYRILNHTVQKFQENQFLLTLMPLLERYIRKTDKRNNSSVLLVLVDTCLNMYRMIKV